MARRRHEKGPWFWRGAIGTMLASVFGLFALMAFNQPPALNDDTHCRVDRKDPAHTILLIDQSDPFTDNDLGWVQEFVDAEARSLPRYGRLTVMTPNAADPYDPRIVFTRCSPGSAEDANPILSNPRMVEDTWARHVLSTFIFRDPRYAQEQAPACLAVVRGSVCGR